MASKKPHFDRLRPALTARRPKGSSGHMQQTLLPAVLSVLTFLFLGMPAAPCASAAPDTWQVFVGTYTGRDSKGIYRLTLDMKTGKLSSAEFAAETPSPSFLALDPRGRYLYAVNEVTRFKDQPTGSVSAFAIAEDGSLTFLNDEASGGGAPCHVVVDASGRHVFAANYVGGSVSVLPVDKEGRLKPASAVIQHKGSSVNPRRQEGPHAHGVYLDRGDRHLLVTDLGLDQVLVYRFDSNAGALSPAEPPHGSLTPGAGPRHLALHPDGRHAYVLNELDCTITIFSYNRRRGELARLDSVSTLRDGETVQPGYSTAEIMIHPGGRFLYSSNRGHDTIAVFAVEERGGRLGLVEHESSGGRTPRSFGIDPTGTYLLAANQDSGNLVVFRIDSETGALTPTGQTVAVPRPVCVVFREGK